MIFSLASSLTDRIDEMYYTYNMTTHIVRIGVGIATVRVRVRLGVGVGATVRD